LSHACTGPGWSKPRRARTPYLSDRSDGGDGGGRDAAQVNLGGDLAICVLLRAVAGDVTSLAALVAGLAGSVKRAAVGGGAVTGDVTQLATSVAFHGLSLAVTGEMVGATALVASGRTRATSEAAATTEAAGVSTTSHRGTTAKCSRADGVGACALRKLSSVRCYHSRKSNCHGISEASSTYSKVARLTTVVAAAAGAGAAQAEGRAVGLNMTESLAVVALLSLSGARQGAAVRLVT
jgi:hypothetical protein